MIDFNEYWGVRLEKVHVEILEMSVVMDLWWTIDSLMHKARLIFNGVVKFKFDSEKFYSSEVVELISLDAKKNGDFFSVSGELSNYDFEIVCSSVSEVRFD